jgi:hypothetical protein
MGAKKSNTRGIWQIAVPLNALALGVALSGFFIPVFTQSPSHLIDDAKSMMAGSGASLSAAVPENPYNTLAQQLDQKEQALNDREASLNARTSGSLISTTGDIFGFVSFALSLLLCGLVGLNFYMDSRRGKKRNVISGRYSVDLS